MRKYFVLISLLIVNCSVKTEVQQNLFDVMLEVCGEKQVLNKVIIMVPQTGCPGCITKAFLLLKDVADARREDVLFVITNISDKKLLRNRISTYYMEQDCTCLDADNLLIEKGYHSIYPNVYFFKDGKQIDAWEMSPDNNDKWELLTKNSIL